MKCIVAHYHLMHFIRYLLMITKWFANYRHCLSKVNHCFLVLLSVKVCRCFPQIIYDPVNKLYLSSVETLYKSPNIVYWWFTNQIITFNKQLTDRYMRWAFFFFLHLFKVQYSNRCPCGRVWVLNILHHEAFRLFSIFSRNNSIVTANQRRYLALFKM